VCVCVGGGAWRRGEGGGQAVHAWLFYHVGQPPTCWPRRHLASWCPIPLLWSSLLIPDRVCVSKCTAGSLTVSAQSSSCHHMPFRGKLGNPYIPKLTATVHNSLHSVALAACFPCVPILCVCAPHLCASPPPHPHHHHTHRSVLLALAPVTACVWRLVCACMATTSQRTSHPLRQDWPGVSPRRGGRLLTSWADRCAARV